MTNSDKHPQLIVGESIDRFLLYIFPGLPSRKPPFPTTLVLGIVSGIALVLCVLLIAVWVVRTRRNNRGAGNHRPSSSGSSHNAVINRIVGSGGLGMSANGNIKVPPSKTEPCNIKKIEKDEDSASRRQPDPDILSKFVLMTWCFIKSTLVIVLYYIYFF